MKDASTFLSGLHASSDQGESGQDDQVASIKKAADGCRQRRREIFDKMKEIRAKNRCLQNTLMDSKEATSVFLMSRSIELSEKKIESIEQSKK